ncbi:MAG: glycosyltransferase family 4 protein [Myxococcota bacterium]
MRILHLCSYPLYSGPLPPTLGLAMAQRALGHTVWLAYDVKRGAFNAYEEAATPWLVDKGLEPPVALTLSAKSTPIEYARDLGRLRGFMTRREVDVVHAHLSHDHGLLALAGNGHGAVTRVRTFHAARSLVRRFGQRWLTRRADGWILRAEEHRERLIASFGTPRELTCVVPGSIDADRFTPPAAGAREKARRRLGVPLDAHVLGHVALITDRGQFELVEAVKQMGDDAPHVLFIGRGENEDALRRTITEAGVGERTHMPGYQRGDMLLDTYAALDAAFVAQPGNDASARAALEAMACGLPVLAIRAGPLAELVDEDVGYPFAERAPESIGNALRTWMSSDDVGRSRGKAGRARVRAERTVAREAERTIAFYEDVMRTKTAEEPQFRKL